MLGVSKDSVSHHVHLDHVEPIARQKTLPPEADPGGRAEGELPDVLGGDAATDQIAAIERELDKLLSGPLSTTARLQVLAERRRTVESRNRVLGPTPTEPVSYRALDDWGAFEQSILSVLDGYPVARSRVAQSLTGAGQASDAWRVDDRALFGETSRWAADLAGEFDRRGIPSGAARAVARDAAERLEEIDGAMLASVPATRPEEEEEA